MIKNMTREQAISLHRQMWEWIAKEIEEKKEVQDIHYLKQQYQYDRGEHAFNDCYCCEYAEQRNKAKAAPGNNECLYCPLEWENPDVAFCPCELYGDEDESMFEIKDGLYGKCRKLFDNCELRDENCWEEQAEYAWQIANLKEKGEIS